MEIINETLIRLKDTDNENNIISCFYTEHPSEFLKMYNFCEHNNLPIQFKDKDSNMIEGLIESIEIHFGGNENIPCIDVWMNKW